MKNVDDSYEQHYNAYRNDFDIDDELNEAKKKKFDQRQFKLGDKKDEESKLTALPKWVSSKIDFNGAIKLIEDVRADKNNVKSSSGDKKILMICVN